ncbi:sensor domain-containing diguanylate cyclase [Kibdelosporangium aridum]|uniref:Sensor domain-containing diguanylate cyclase n=1 Tax=Kibdelosporangium aridum TaxID=2030 RepID=A0A428ZQT7_KIBAR|nr:diguanylate cyclase [Kibdelosporangium aridum]RSM90420.1 sensor domain-containing diguanylate cyclase [Kibdelosporangium aridum]
MDNPRDFRGARLLNAPSGVLPYYLTLELAAVMLPVILPGRVVTGQDWVWFVALLAAAVTQAELSVQVERMRRFFSNNPHVNMTSVWLFAGALLLPLSIACALAALTYAHLWLRIWRAVPSVRLYRAVCSAATAALSVIAAQSALSLPLGPVSVVAGGVTYMLVNLVLVVIGFRLHHPSRTFVSLTGSFAEHLLEATTLCLGGITAVLLIEHPIMILLVLLPVVLLPRGDLSRQLHMTSGYDAKTGVLTAGEWQRRTSAELARASQACGVLMIDVDFFKRINDTHGHLAGDAVLRAIASTISDEVRKGDLVGRFGGEEFVVLLPMTSHDHSLSVAERIRRAVTLLEVTHSGTVMQGISVSIGVAVRADSGVSLDDVLAAADQAMYRAKKQGRNKVCAAVRAPGARDPSRGSVAMLPP